MQKLILVGWREFKQRIRTRGFLLGSLIVPLVLIVVWAFTGVFETERQEAPLESLSSEGQDITFTGYVDHANLIKEIPPQYLQGCFSLLRMKNPP